MMTEHPIKEKATSLRAQSPEIQLGQQTRSLRRVRQTTVATTADQTTVATTQVPQVRVPHLPKSMI
jgi:hypothetical protein